MRYLCCQHEQWCPGKNSSFRHSSQTVYDTTESCFSSIFWCDSHISSTIWLQQSFLFLVWWSIKHLSMKMMKIAPLWNFAFRDAFPEAKVISKTIWMFHMTNGDNINNSCKAYFQATICRPSSSQHSESFYNWILHLEEYRLMPLKNSIYRQSQHSLKFKRWKNHFFVGKILQLF